VTTIAIAMPAAKAMVYASEGGMTEERTRKTAPVITVFVPPTRRKRNAWVGVCRLTV